MRKGFINLQGNRPVYHSEQFDKGVPRRKNPDMLDESLEKLQFMTHSVLSLIVSSLPYYWYQSIRVLGYKISAHSIKESADIINYLPLCKTRWLTAIFVSVSLVLRRSGANNVAAYASSMKMRIGSWPVQVVIWTGRVIWFVPVAAGRVPTVVNCNLW